MFKVFLVGLGGFIGSVLRYLVAGLAQRAPMVSRLPNGTLTVNLLGCLLIGYLTGLAEARQLFSPEVRALVLIGFLGGFTTFSTFGFETFSLLRDGQMLTAGLNMGLHLVLGVGFVWVGFALSRTI